MLVIISLCGTISSLSIIINYNTKIIIFQMNRSPINLYTASFWHEIIWANVTRWMYFIRVHWLVLLWFHATFLVIVRYFHENGKTVGKRGYISILVLLLTNVPTWIKFPQMNRITVVLNNPPFSPFSPKFLMRVIFSPNQLSLAKPQYSYTFQKQVFNYLLGIMFFIMFQ